MASGHVNRVNRPNTWLHRPMLQNVKKALANSEPSTHGAKRLFAVCGRWIPVTRRCKGVFECVSCADVAALNPSGLGAAFYFPPSAARRRNWRFIALTLET
jgi:hypothetical protein